MKKNLMNLMIYVVGIAVVGFCPFYSHAQFRPQIDVQEWPQGKVVLFSGDTIYGNLTYHRTQEILNVQHEDGTISTFSPVNVEYFVAQELPSGRSHLFRTLQWNLGRDYSDFRKPTFFEELNRGPLTLVMREAYILRDANSINSLNQSYLYDPAFYDPNSQWREQVKELYYILLPDGDIIPLRNIRKDLHTLFGDRSKEVKSYIKQNKLDYERPHQLVAIVNYFNTLAVTTTRGK